MSDPTPSDIIELLERLHVPEVLEGVAVAVQDRFVRVRILGSTTFQDAEVGSGVSIVPGQNVTIMRTPTTAKWIVVGVFEPTWTGTSVQGLDHSVLSPPNNFTVAGDFRVIVGTWECPAHVEDLTFEVEIADDDSGTNSETLLVTRGSVCLYHCSPGTTKYMRVRTLKTDHEPSAWTDWQSGTSMSSTTAGSYIDLEHTTTPAAPASGHLLLYAKSDDGVYTLDSAGTEVGPLGMGDELLEWLGVMT